MDILLNERQELNKSHIQKHIIHEISLKKKYKKVIVEYSFAPKYLEDELENKEIIITAMERYGMNDYSYHEKVGWQEYGKLKNQVTISIDDNNGFRGCAHRRDQYQKYILSTEEASPGFISGEVPMGKFRLTVSIHALVTEKFEYNIKISGI